MSSLSPNFTESKPQEVVFILGVKNVLRNVWIIISTQMVMKSKKEPANDIGKQKKDGTPSEHLHTDITSSTKKKNLHIEKPMKAIIRKKPKPSRLCVLQLDRVV